MAEENEFPTIGDFCDVLNKIRSDGFGDLPAQVLVVPDSTIQALARHAGAKDDDKPALMLLFRSDNSRPECGLVTTDRMQDTTPRNPIQ